MDRGWDRADRMEGIFLLFSRLFSRFFFRREVGIGFEEAKKICCSKTFYY